MTSGQLKRMFKKEGIRMWEIAEVLGIHEVTFGRWFRHEDMPKDRELSILSAVEEIKLRRSRPGRDLPEIIAAETLAEAVNSIKIQKPVRTPDAALDDEQAF